jgi:uncharacterized membrane protein
LDDRTSTTPDQQPTPIGRVEIVISTLLRAGILASLFLVLLGVVVMFVRHPDYLRSPEALAHLKSDEYVFPTTITSVFRGVAQGQGRSIILLGVFVLFLTPLLRVVTSIVAYVIEKDWRFVAITSLVLVFLLLSLVLGKIG